MISEIDIASNEFDIKKKPTRTKNIRKISMKCNNLK